MNTRRSKKNGKKRGLFDRLRSVPHLFAKIIIVHCIIVVTIAAYYSLWAQRNGADMVDLFKAIGYFFIAELAFLFGKTIYYKKWGRDKEEKGDDLHGI